MSPRRRSPRQGLRRAADAAAAGVPAAVPARRWRWRSPRSSARSVLQLAQPYLMKLAIDRYIADRRSRRARPDRAASTSSILVGVVRRSSTSQTWTLQLTGQRIMFDLRMADLRPPAAARPAFYDRNPVGRLMTRVTTDVDVLNDLFTSGVVTIFGDVFTLVGIMIVMLCDELAAGAGRLRRAAADRRWSRSGSGATCASRTATVRGWIARINAFLQENITGMSTVQLFRREALQLRAVRRDRPQAPRRQHRLDLLLRGVLSGDRDRRRAGRRR